MNGKSNQILLGVILLLIGVFSLLKTFIRIDYGTITLFVTGMAFLLLYRTKGKSWSLVVGGYITYFAVSKFLLGAGLIENIAQMLAGMFFLVPGLIFLELFYHKNKQALLVPSCLLCWFGVALVACGLIPSIKFGGVFGILVLCFGLAFCTVYYFGRFYISRAILYFGIIMAVAGGAILLGLPLAPGGIGIPVPGKFSALALIAISIVIIFRAFRKKD